MAKDELRPIIIKRKKVVAAAGHHGGAWKVAYADFVTAMMAFFMLMWLLNATTEKQRKGLADYFTPTIAIARVSGGGAGALGGDNMMSQSNLSASGIGGFVELPPSDAQSQGGASSQDGKGSTDAEDLAEVEKGLLGRGGESLIAEMAMKHIVTRVTDKGLVVEIFDLDGAPLFDGQSARPNPVLVEVGRILVEVFGFVENRMSVAGHTRTYPPILISNPAWDISTMRAHAMRALLEDLGIGDARIEQVTGYGERKPLLENRMAPRNNRLEITLLRDFGRN